jgi:methylmalonyl-CoA mutase
VTLGSLDAFEHVVDAAAGNATMDEIGRALTRGAREVADSLPCFREASVFEDLSDAADRMHRRPRVFLACLGPLAGHSARAAFATHLFHAGALDVVQSQAGLDTSALADAYTESGATIACLCGADADYDERAGEVLRALHANGARSILIARRVVDGDDALRAEGLAGHVHLGCDAETLLRRLLELEGAVLPAPEVVA